MNKAAKTILSIITLGAVSTGSGLTVNHINQKEIQKQKDKCIEAEDKATGFESNLKTTIELTGEKQKIITLTENKLNDFKKIVQAKDLKELLNIKNNFADRLTKATEEEKKYINEQITELDRIYKLYDEVYTQNKNLTKIINEQDSSKLQKIINDTATPKEIKTAAQTIYNRIKEITNSKDAIKKSAETIKQKDDQIKNLKEQIKPYETIEYDLKITFENDQVKNNFYKAYEMMKIITTTIGEPSKYAILTIAEKLAGDNKQIDETEITKIYKKMNEMLTEIQTKNPTTYQSIQEQIKNMTTTTGDLEDQIKAVTQYKTEIEKTLDGKTTSEKIQILKNYALDHIINKTEYEQIKAKYETAKVK